MVKHYKSDGTFTIEEDIVVEISEEERKRIDFTREQQELLKWFEEYDKQVKQYQRCQRQGVEFDKDIAELDEQASVNQARLREINEFFKPKVVEEIEDVNVEE